MPLQATSGAASYDAYGGGVAVVPTYIEDVFSCFLYTGTGATQTITNGIDLSTKGGLVWLKCRSNAFNNYLADTSRGITNYLSSNSTGEQNFAATVTDMIASTSTTGFVLGSGATLNGTNNSGQTHASWTFRKQPKFFDIQTWTGTGSTGAISHSHALGSTPGCIIIKAVSTNEGAWYVYHRSLGVGQVLALNSTAASSNASSPDAWTVSSTQFSVNTSQLGENTNGTTYIAYLFAHDAGGFGLTGTDNVISCGSFTTDGSAYANVNLGYEPQWVMCKRTDGVGNWQLNDNMRGMTTYGGQIAQLYPNLSNAEGSGTGGSHPTATGFESTGLGVSQTYIYIAIRRGPMKVPTTGTSVFAPIARTGNDTETKVTGVGFSPDLWMAKSRNISADFPFFDRLRGVTKRVVSNSTYLEESFSGSNGLVSLDMDGITIGAGATDGGICNDTGTNYANLLFKRAPSFMDVVCYTGTGSSMSITHNLGVGPELVIVKRRNSTSDWVVAAKINSTEYTVGANGNELALNSSGGGTTTYFTYATYFSSTAFQTGAFWTTPSVNTATYVAYLFATCAGVSKVGSYTGTGTTKQIDCGFTAGARFVLIKKTSGTGSWYVWDSARGIVSGNDPYLLLNSTAAEVTSTDYIDTYAAGFEISSTAPSEINENGGSFIFLAIA